MKARSSVALVVLCLGVAMAIPLGAQTLLLRANIPFEFSFSGQTLPAGEYVFQAEASAIALRVRSLDGGAGAVGLARQPMSYNGPRTGEARINFNKYGNSYFLSSVVNGFNGASLDLPAGINERELAHTASVQKLHIVAALARP